MPIEFRCTNCRRRLQVPRRWAGDAIDCPRCAAKIVVPQQVGVSEGGVFESRSFERSLEKLEPHQQAEPEDDAGVWDAASLADLASLEVASPSAAASAPAVRPRRRRSRRALGLYACIGLAVLASAAVIGAFWLFKR